MKFNILKKGAVLCSVALASITALTSCNEEPDGSNLFSSDELTISQTLQQNPDVSAFYAILQKCGYDKRLSTYLEYTCFAPVNDGVSEYLDSLYEDDNVRFAHNGIEETANFESLSVEEKVALMSDSLCEDISKYHISGALFTQSQVSGSLTWSTLLTGRKISISIFESGDYSGKVSLNAVSAITDGDIECVNGYLNICSSVIARSDRTTDDQIKVDGNYNIFYDALVATGLNDSLQIDSKGITYDAVTMTSDSRDCASDGGLYNPTECQIKWTVFAETDAVFQANGINDFDDLAEKCKEWYGNCATWYDYINEKGITISTGTDYENEFNVVHMFMAYHILKVGIPIDQLVYEQPTDQNKSPYWNVCFGYEPQEYYETILPHTLIKAWGLNPKSSKELYLNRYRMNNTLTDQIGTFGSDATHTIIYEGVPLGNTSTRVSTETLNGYVHRINDILLYDQNVVNSQNERMRFDTSNFLYELANNGVRGASVSDISALNGGGDGNRVAFNNEYFDNVVCYNPSTILRFCVLGEWRAHNSDQFQGWDVYDLAFKLPHVPTGEYELRLIYPPMIRGGLMQFYMGNSSNQGDMVALGIPFDANADPTTNDYFGVTQILTEDDDPDTDYGVASDQTMHVRGYMRAPASFSRGTYNTITEKLSYDESDIYSAAKNITGSTSCRSEWGYGTMMLRYIVTTMTFEQGKDYWFRIKNLVNDSNLGWSFDFMELCPTSIVNSQNMTEDWY